MIACNFYFSLLIDTWVPGAQWLTGAWVGSLQGQLPDSYGWGLCHGYMYVFCEFGCNNNLWQHWFLFWNLVCLF